MKHVMIVPDGMADHPLEGIEGRTPLEAAKTPHMDWLAQQGTVGMVRTIPHALDPGSDVSCLSLLGYDPAKYYTGRGALEAMDMRIPLGENDLVFRMNFVTEWNGELADYSAGHISSTEGRVLIAFLNRKLGSKEIRFYPGVGYRHIVVIRDHPELGGVRAHCVAPHEIEGEQLSDHFPVGPGGEFLKKLMLDARLLLQDHEVNEVRVDLGENPANMAWLWGQGRCPALPSFESARGMKGAVVAAVQVVRGIARAAGMRVADVEGATGYTDTNYRGKGEAAVALAEDHDFVFVHVEAPDEAGHRGNLKLKMMTIEEIDAHIVAPVRAAAEKRGDMRVTVACDHATPCALKKHTRERVPFLAWGPGVPRDEVERFSEAAAKFSRTRFESGQDLLSFLCEGAGVGAGV